MPDQKKIEEAARHIRERMVNICLGGKVDARTYLSLLKHGTVKVKNLLEDVEPMIKTLDEQDSSLCSIKGPYVFYLDSLKKECVIIKISDLILNINLELRKAAVDYICRQDISCYMSPKTTSEIARCKPSVLSNRQEVWIDSAIAITDTLEDDWLFNYQGVLQAQDKNDEEGFSARMTRIMQPEIISVENIGKGVLFPTNNPDEIKNEIKNIVKESSNLQSALDLYYDKYGHIPLSKSLSICYLYDHWLATKGSVDSLWQTLWDWTDTHPGPIPRYHVCFFFVNKESLVPEDKKSELVNEILQIICQPEEEINNSDSWLLRAELARYYCQYLECRLPGSHGEKIATQSWWLADKVASLCGNNPEHIKNFRKQTIQPEEELTNNIWRLVHLGTESSSLRYATLYIKSLWSLSLVSQLDKNILSLIFSIATTKQIKKIEEAISGNLINLFPINQSDKKDQTFAYEKGCLAPAQRLLEFMSEGKERELNTAFIAGVEKVTSDEGFKQALKRLPEGNVGDQLLTVHSLQIMGHMNIAPKEFVWDCISDIEWSKNVFRKLDSLSIQHFFDGLTEIQLRSKDKWDEQLPHFYAMLCEELRDDKEKQKLLFACTVISSLAADSVSGIDRLLKGEHRFDFVDEVKFLKDRLNKSSPYMPEWCRARIRAISAVLPD